MIYFFLLFIIYFFSHSVVSEFGHNGYACLKPPVAGDWDRPSTESCASFNSRNFIKMRLQAPSLLFRNHPELGNVTIEKFLADKPHLADLKVEYLQKKNAQIWAVRNKYKKSESLSALPEEIQLKIFRYAELLSSDVTFFDYRNASEPDVLNTKKEL